MGAVLAPKKRSWADDTDDEFDEAERMMKEKGKSLPDAPSVAFAGPGLEVKKEKRRAVVPVSWA